MINSTDGTPALAYASLTPGAPGPTTFTLFTVMGAASVALQANERFYITNITINSNDTSAAPVPIITVDSGGTTPTFFAHAYVNNIRQLQPIAIPPGVARSILGIMPRAGSTISGSASVGNGTVEIVLKGYVSKT
jgi:hypothetical protein